VGEKSLNVDVNCDPGRRPAASCLVFDQNASFLDHFELSPAVNYRQNPTTDPRLSMKKQKKIKITGRTEILLAVMVAWIPEI
jgi:hypothetical protein